MSDSRFGAHERNAMEYSGMWLRCGTGVGKGAEPSWSHSRQSAGFLCRVCGCDIADHILHFCLWGTREFTGLGCKCSRCELKEERGASIGP